MNNLYYINSGVTSHYIEEVATLHNYTPFDIPCTIWTAANHYVQACMPSKALIDKSYSYFIKSLPSTLNIFITLYNNPMHNVDLLCDKFAKYKMWQKLHEAKSRKAEAAAKESITLSQQSKDKEVKRKRHDLTNVMCYGCGKKGHLKHKCPDKEDKKEKGKEVESRPSEVSNKNRGQAGTLYTAMSPTALLANKKLTDYYYIDSGAPDHLVPSKGKLRAYKEFASPIEIAAANRARFMPMVPDHCK